MSFAAPLPGSSTRGRHHDHRRAPWWNRRQLKRGIRRALSRWLSESLEQDVSEQGGQRSGLLRSFALPMHTAYPGDSRTKHACDRQRLRSLVSLKPDFLSPGHARHATPFLLAFASLRRSCGKAIDLTERSRRFNRYEGCELVPAKYGDQMTARVLRPFFSPCAANSRGISIAPFTIRSMMTLHRAPHAVKPPKASSFSNRTATQPTHTI